MESIVYMCYLKFVIYVIYCSKVKFDSSDVKCFLLVCDD